MDRRSVIKSLGFLSLHTLYPSVLAAFLSGCHSADAGKTAGTFFNEEELTLVREVIDILLPATRTQSASEVGVHLFLDDVFAQCLNEDQKGVVREGIARLVKTWAGGTDKTDLVAALDKEAYSGQEDSAWFKTFKQYTMIGFFTSQEGTTRAGNYQKIPDRYIGEILIGENELAHGRTSLNFHI
jgi:hypothetical protein